MVQKTIIDCVAIGRVCRETIVSVNKHLHENLLAGPVLYAASGMRSLMENIGVISAIPDFDKGELSALLNEYFIDETGVVVQGSKVKKQFFGYASPDSQAFENPIPFFSSLQMKLPALLS